MPKTDQQSCSYPRLSGLKISFFSFCRADKFSAFAGFIGVPYYAPRTPFCYKTLTLWNFMRRAGKFNQILQNRGR